MEARTLVLIGRTGNGKSATGNSILGRDAFATEGTLLSGTKECRLEACASDGGRKLNVVDTPGLFHKDSSKEHLQTELAKCIDLVKDGVHGVLYVVSVRNRFTAEEAAVLDTLQNIFGPNIVNYIVVIFTGGDDLEDDGVTLEEYLKDCPQKLEEVLQRCNKRMVLFDNETTSITKKTKQRNELLKHIDNIISENRGRPYSFDPFHEEQTGLNIRDREKRSISPDSALKYAENEENVNLPDKPRQAKNYAGRSTQNPTGAKGIQCKIISEFKRIRSDCKIL